MAKVKPKVSVRKPPPAADDFVAGEMHSKETSKRLVTKTFRRPSVQASESVEEPQGGGDGVEKSLRASVVEPQGGVGTSFGKAVVKRADGKKLRRMTVYMPPELAKRLQIAAVTHERDMSDIITEAVGSWLDSNV